MSINTEVNQLTNEVLALREEIVGLKAVIRDLKDTGIGKVCPSCKSERMINLTTFDEGRGMRLCGCTYWEPYRLKKGQKSVQIKNLVGE